MEPCGSLSLHAAHHYVAADSNGYWCAGYVEAVYVVDGERVPADVFAQTATLALVDLTAKHDVARAALAEHLDWLKGHQRACDEGAARIAELEAEVLRLRTVPADLAIVGTWLVERVSRHTCGTGPDGYYGQHEPGCGEEPIVDLSTVPGFTDLIAPKETPA